MVEIEGYIKSPAVTPYFGWHDDYDEFDKAVQYRPAMQQDREEFLSVLKMIADKGLVGGRCLQLGLGRSAASHWVWKRIFGYVLSIDREVICDDEGLDLKGLDTHSQEAIDLAAARKPYDFLFIDAGHTYGDVAADFMNYGYMVRRGGLIAFHDALPRAVHPSIEVHKFIEHLPVTVFGDEVGTAVMEVT